MSTVRQRAATGHESDQLDKLNSGEKSAASSLGAERIYQTAKFDDVSSTGLAPSISPSKALPPTGKLKPEKSSSLEIYKQGAKQRRPSRKETAPILFSPSAESPNNMSTYTFAKSPPELLPDLEDAVVPQNAQQQVFYKSKIIDSKISLGSPGKVKLAPIDGNGQMRSSLSSFGYTNTDQPQLEPFKLSIESTINDFRAFQASMRHPGLVLNLSAKEDDGEVYSEFDDLCNELLVVLAELESALEDVTLWKDDFLKQSVPSAVKLEIVLLFGKMFRSKSDLHQPIFDLIKAVRLYSRPWGEKRHAMLQLQAEYQRQYQVLDISIRKLENMQAFANKLKTRHRVSLWERLIYKLIDFENDNQGILASIPSLTTNAVTPYQVAASNMATAPTSVEQNPSLPFRAAHEASLSASLSGSTTNDTLRSIDLALLKLKATICSYIVDEPDWQKRARFNVKQFKLLLKKNFPAMNKIWPNYLRRPFPERNAKIKYLSTRTGTIIIRRKLFPTPSSISCQDFKELWQYHQDLEERAAELEQSNYADKHQTDEFGFEIDAGSRQSIDNPDSPFSGNRRNIHMLRCNSFNTLLDIGKRGQLKRPLLGDHTGRHISPYGSDLSDNYTTQQLSTDDSASEEDVDEDYSDVDEKYFRRFHEEEIQEAINAFLDTHPNKERSYEDESKKENNVLEIESEKDSFTIQDVIELTLLHAQQMQLLQSEYSDRIARMAGQIDQLQQDQIDMTRDWERRLQQAQDHAQRLTLQSTETDLYPDVYVDAQEGQTRTSSIFRRKPSKTITDRIPVARSKQTPVDNKLPPEQEREQEIDIKMSKLMSRIERRRQDALKKSKKVPKPKTRTLPPRRPPKFTSTPMALSFMERLRWFTEVSLRKRDESRLAAMRMETHANEQRLVQLNLVHEADDSTDYVDANNRKSMMYAEFMPMPGAVPVPKHHHDIWSEQGITMPWGGRFKTTPDTSQSASKKVNVLNLFDVALSIRPASSLFSNPEHPSSSSQPQQQSEK